MAFPISNLPYLWDQDNSLNPFLWQQEAQIQQQQQQQQQQQPPIPPRQQITSLDDRGLPICDCHYFYQYHSCGCPDLTLKPNSGSNINNNRPPAHVPSLRKCAVHFLPSPAKWNLIFRGFCHREPLSSLPVDPTPRILPFPCYKHMTECRINLSKSELSRRLAMNNDPHVNYRLALTRNRQLLELQAMKRDWDTSIKPCRSLKRQREDDDEDNQNNGEDRARRVKRFRPAGAAGRDGGEENDQEQEGEAQAIRRLSCTTNTNTAATAGASSSSSSVQNNSNITRRPSLLDICGWHRTLKTFQYSNGNNKINQNKNNKNIKTRPLPLDPWFHEEQTVNLYKFDEKPFARLDWAPGRDNGNPLYPRYGRMGNGMYELGGWIEDEARMLETARTAWERRGVDIKTVLDQGVRTDAELDM